MRIIKNFYSLPSSQFSRGAIVVTFLTIAPVLLATMILIFGHFQTLQFVRYSKAQCRNDVLMAHNELVNNLKKVINLNYVLMKFRNLKQLALSLIASGEITTGSALLKIAEKGLKSTLILQQNFLMITEIKWAQRVHQVFSRKHQEKKIYELSTHPLWVPYPEFKIPVRRSDSSNPYSDLIIDPSIEKKLLLTKIWKHESKLIFKGDHLWGQKKSRPYHTYLGCQSKIKWISNVEVQAQLSNEVPFWLKGRLFF